MRIWGLGAFCRAAGAVVTLGAHPALAEDARGLTLEAGQVIDVLGLVSGGNDPGVSTLYKTDLRALWKHGDVTAYADLQYVGGDAFSGDRVGDAQVISNIEAPAATRVLEAWVSRTWNAGRAGLKAGLIDLNSEFDVQSVGALFLNSSHGVGPDLSQTGLAGPSIFPNTGLAVTAYRSVGDWTLRAGVFDGAPGDPDDPRRTRIELSRGEGALLIAEIDRKLGENALLRAGAWAYTARFSRIEDPARDGRSAGGYVLVEGKLWSERDAPEQGLSAWGRIGLTDGAVNVIDRYVGGGFAYAGVLFADDQLGVAISRARFSDPARRAQGLEAAETALELTWAFPVGEVLTLQPDVQYVWSPGGVSGAKDALVVGLRASVTLSR
jgi:porin